MMLVMPGFFGGISHGEFLGSLKVFVAVQSRDMRKGSMVCTR
jgi:hypothetical protein